jgi:cytoskeletal protein RodZ
VGDSGSPYDAGRYSKNDSSLGVNTDELFSSAEDPSPWYLKPWVLALWGVAVAILIATIIFGLVELATGNGSRPATAPSSTTKPSATTTSPTTATTSTPTETTTTSVPPETTAPPMSTQPWTPQHPRRHWWNGDLPNFPNVPNFPRAPGHNP